MKFYYFADDYKLERVNLIWRVTVNFGEGRYRSKTGGTEGSTDYLLTRQHFRDLAKGRQPNHYPELTQEEANDLCKSWGHTFASDE